MVQRQPKNVEFYPRLAMAYQNLNDHLRLLWSLQRWAELTPDDPEVILPLAGAYLKNLRPALARKVFRDFLERWPQHREADDARKMLAELEGPRMRETVEDMGLPWDGGIELAALHERAQLALEQGDPEEARRWGEELLSRLPGYVPALNNLSLACFAEGRLEEAIAMARRILDEFEPENFHALSNLIHFLVTAGRDDEAKALGERLKGLHSERVDFYVKQAEGLAYLRDDAGVLEVVAQAQQAGRLAGPLADPLIFHLAAVAAARLGRDQEARRYWRQCLRIAPGFDLAVDNLAEGEKPVGERHGAWPFGLWNWLPPRIVEDLMALVRTWTQKERRGEEEEEGAAAQVFQRFLQQHPEAVALVPILLERGDPRGRELAFILAQGARTPELLAALRDFALSQNGPDELRLKAVQEAMRAGLLPRGKPARLWQGGEWRDILIFGFALHDEPRQTFSRRVTRWMEQALDAFQRGDLDEAERLLKQVLDKEPDAMAAWQNLAAIYGLRGQAAQAVAITRQLVERHPDYVIGRCNLARFALQLGQVEEAERWLEPLLEREDFHFSEFSMFCDTQLQLLEAQGQENALRSWLELWRNALPGDPRLADWERKWGRARPRSRRDRRQR